MRLRAKQSGFTLLELVMVMLVIAIIAGLLAPAMLRFTAGRAVDNFGRQIVGVAQHARAQSISEARIYRLNFDAGSGQFWLTADNGNGKFIQPSGDLSQRFTAPAGVKMQIVQNAQSPPSPVLLLPWSTSVQPEAYSQPAQLLDGTAAGTGSIWVYPPNATFVQFHPTGRADPASIMITDNSGHSVRVVCDSSTETFREVAQ